jgi:hypothetical protein
MLLVNQLMEVLRFAVEIDVKNIEVYKHRQKPEKLAWHGLLKILILTPILQKLIQIKD